MAGCQPEAACAWLLERLAALPPEQEAQPLAQAPHKVSAEGSGAGAQGAEAQQRAALTAAAEAMRLPVVDIRLELSQLADLQAALQLPAEAVYQAVT